MSTRMSVHAMVQQVLKDSKAKLASDKSSKTKTASAEPSKTQPAGSRSGQGVNDFLKIADACDHLAKYIHLVNDERTPQEKLAEYAAIHDELKKRAFDVGNGAPPEPSQPSDAGDNSTGPHQTREAGGEYQSPKTVTTNNSGTGVGGSTAIPSEPTNTPGTTPLKGGDSGQAIPALIPPSSTSPTEKPNPQDAANAMETNKDMMMADQPEALLKQNAALPKGFAQNIKKVRAAQDPSKPGAEIPASLKKKAMVLLKRAQDEGIPSHVARAMLKMAGLEKAAEDALNPAQISAGTEPELQSAAGIPSPLSQGSVVGENTPRETAPTGGVEGGGRDILSSVESVINASKGEAKQHVKKSLSQLLAEPALSSAHDDVLQKSLDNTSEAGVKISAAQVNAARELLRKFQDSSPGNAQKLAALAKLADDPDMAAGGGAPPAPGEMALAPEEETAGLEGGPEGEAAEAPSDEAMEAARAGVTPEELAQAQEMLETQEALAAQAPPEEEAGAEAPVQGGEEKESMMGSSMGGMGGAGMSAPPPVTM
jgi:hypothetical protein